MPSPGDRRRPIVGSVGLSRRRFLAGLAGMPILLGLASCTSGGSPQPPSDSSPTTTGSPSPTPSPSPLPHVDAPALEAAAADAIALLATYEATLAVHPSLGPLVAPYVADHDTHLEAIAERITLPTSSPTSPPVPPRSVTATSPTGGPTDGPTDGPTAGPTAEEPSVPADPGVARAALVTAEEATGKAAREAARSARDGEVARLLASIGASRAVHALLLGVPA